MSSTGPTVDEDPRGGERHELDDLTFDLTQYTTEVLRATADRSWETDRRATARLLSQRLSADQDKLTSLGFHVGNVSPQADNDAVIISMTKEGRQQFLRVPFTDGSPDMRADQMAATLWSVPAAQWRGHFSEGLRWPGWRGPGDPLMS